jgi:hypothetical protein
LIARSPGRIVGAMHEEPVTVMGAIVEPMLDVVHDDLAQVPLSPEMAAALFGPIVDARLALEALSDALDELAAGG